MTLGLLLASAHFACEGAVQCVKADLFKWQKKVLIILRFYDMW